MEFAKKFQLDQAMTGVAPVFELQTHVPKAVDIEHNAMQQQGCFQDKKWKTKIKKTNGIEPQGHRMKTIHIYPVYVSVDRERERERSERNGFNRQGRRKGEDVRGSVPICTHPSLRAYQPLSILSASLEHIHDGHRCA